MTEHTKLPWDFDGNCGGYISQDGEKIARARSLRDAEFIVQAVNSYPEMREALLPFANLANCYDDELDPDDRPVGPVALKFCRAARKALATDREVKE